MLSVNDVVKYEDTQTNEEIFGVVTKIVGENYVSVLAEDGRVYSSVYVGHLTKTDYKLPVLELFDEFTWLRQL